jgi:arylsulfatase A-like enzyme
VFQELVHVPLLIYYPERFPAGKHVTTNVSIRRLFHTVLDITDIVPPLAEDDPNAAVQDLSLISSLNGRPDTEQGIAYAEAFPPLNLVNVIERRSPAMLENLHLTKVRRGVYDGNHKLAIVGDKVESLFDVASDPTEKHDLASDHPTLVDALQQKMKHFVLDAQSQRLGTVDNGEVSDDVLDNLRALGYFE